MKYSDTHEWIKLHDGNIGVVGISAFIQKELGEIVFVELPQKGKHFAKGEFIGVLESTKSASDIYSPVNGTIVEVNESIVKDLSKINNFPESLGWLYKIKIDKIDEYNSLMDKNEYDYKVLD
jgi:glycine cleavage system H protein